MPIQYDEPLYGISISVAEKEAIAHSPAAKPRITTITFEHPTFRDDEGKPTGLYLVAQRKPFIGTLEADAPHKGGQQVEFQPAPIEYFGPRESDEGRSPDIKLKISNLSKEIIAHIRHATMGDSVIEMIVRTYYESNTSAPHEMPPPRMDVGPVSFDRDTITITASFGFLVNAPFPLGTYSPSRFPGLMPGG